MKGVRVTFEELEQEVQELKARAAADTAFLRCAIFTMSTMQLGGAKQALDELAEDMTVKLLYMRSVSDKANQAFEERKRFWLDALREEVAARDGVERA
jgi:hypothetical protein